MEKKWFKHYHPETPHTINPDEYGSLVDLIESSCKKYKHNIAFINLGSSISYQELDEKSLAFAHFLQHLGLQQGCRVALMLPNILQYPIALFGVLRAGMIAVNTNPLYTADEVAHQMTDSGSEVIIVLANFAKTVQLALDRTPLKHVIITELGDCFAPWKRLLANFIIKYIKKMVPHYNLAKTNVIAFNNYLSIQPVKKFIRHNITHQDIALLQYTGGTTGVSKGAMLTHGNLVANLLQAYTWLQHCNLGPNDRVITALPLYHIFSLTANCLVFLKTGSKNLLITNPRDIQRFINSIKNFKFTVMTGVNTLYKTLLDHPDIAKVDFSHLKIALSGGMALQAHIAERWQAYTHNTLIEAYGLTEASPAVTINIPDKCNQHGCIGLPLPSTDVSIRNEQNQEVSPNEPGELCVKGPQVMAGYWHHPEETAAVMTQDGYLKTGDIATMDEQGFVYIADRKKEMIIISGFNVYPTEIEQVIARHPGVKEVAIIGIKQTQATTGEITEIVKACIVKQDPKLTPEAITQYCREHLTAYKIPKRIEFYAELPKTAVGKILKRALNNS